jgi:hypothetical protein
MLVRLAGRGLALLEFLLFGLDHLLLVDLRHVVLTFDSSLFSQTSLLLAELSLPGHLQIGSNALSLFLLEFLAEAGLPLTFLEGSLGTQGIDLRLSVGGFLLHFAEALDLPLLLVLFALGFELSLELLLILGTLVSHDRQVLVFNFLGT